MPKLFMEPFEEIDGLEPGDMSQAPFPWWKKLLFKLAPKLFFRLMARESGWDEDLVDHADILFRDKKIHIDPLSGTNGRGFIICLNNKLTLWFFQDGDHFVYDGFEMGEYDDGEVTVFDSLKQK